MKFAVSWPIYEKNQTRLNVGQIFGNPETVPGGKALPFYAAYRIALRKAGRETEAVDVWDGEKTVKTNRITVQKIRAKIEKSKMSAPYTEIFFDFDLIEFLQNPPHLKILRCYLHCFHLCYSYLNMIGILILFVVFVPFHAFLVTFLWKFFPEISTIFSIKTPNK